MLYQLKSHERNTGSLSPENKQLLGVYSWWESIKLGGTGSPKVKYLSGINELDNLINAGTDLLQVNFEICKKALLIRIWQHNNCYVYYFFLKDVINVSFCKRKLIFKLNNFKELKFTFPQSPSNAIQKFLNKTTLKIHFV